MKGIRQRDTAPEIAVRNMVRAQGAHYRTSPKALPGRPDLANVSRGWAIFVHGCFWHGHDCRLGTIPKKNREWWLEKLAGNRARDARKVDALEARGLRVLTVWQCELANPEALRATLRRFLPSPSEVTRTQ